MNGKLENGPGIAMQMLANAVCEHLPSGFVLSLQMENGSAWIELQGLNGGITLPDASDKDLLGQINDAICVANGFDI